MSPIGAPLVGSYDDRLVVLSILIAISASYSALDLGGRVAAARGWLRSAWLAGGAAAMGLGIWSMHFTGMLAFTLPVPVAYHWPTVVLSLLAAILASAVALYVASRRKKGHIEAFIGSVPMGLGIVGMHYIGMAAMRLSAGCHYSPPLVTLSVLVAILASLGALVFREDFRGTTFAKILSATVMGVAISLMHYIGMASASFYSSVVPMNLARTVNISSLGTGGIAIVTLIVQGAAMLTSSMDQQLAKQASEIETSHRFRQIADILRDVLLLCNSDLSEILFVNGAYEPIWGRTLESLYADPKSWLEGVHPQDREHVEDHLQCLIGGQPIDNLEFRVVRPVGSIAWVRLRARPALDSQGHPYRVVGSFHEFTMRRRAEEARRQSEEQHRTVVETATDAVISIDEAGQILLVNPATTKIFGYELSELVGRPLMMLMPEYLRELHNAGLQRYLATGQRHMNWQGRELVGLRKNGEEFPVEVSFGEVVKQGHPIFIGFVRDITDRKKAEQELRLLSGRLLRSQDEERRKIARDLHDSTGQELVALATMLGQLRGSIPSGDRKPRRLLSECKTLAEKCIREVRTLSYVLHPPLLDDAGLADAIRDYVKGFTKQSGIQVELELSPHVGRMARDIELALFRVVQESLTNIQRHSGSQLAKIRVHRNSDLKLEISDLGGGLSDSVQKGNEQTRLEIGVGIPSMQERVKLIGGRLDVSSTGHGTIVSATVPLRTDEREKASNSDR